MDTIRRTVLFQWKEGLAPEEKLRAKEGLAYIAYASKIRNMDFGEQLAIAGQASHSFMLMHDHDSLDALDEYDRNPHHHRVGAYIDTLTSMTDTARVTWQYSGPALTKGNIHHTAMFNWREDVNDFEKQRVWNDLASLERSEGVVGVAWGEDCTTINAHFDWIYDVQLANVDAARSFLNRVILDGLADALSATTSAEASIQHRILCG